MSTTPNLQNLNDAVEYAGRTHPLTISNWTILVLFVLGISYMVVSSVGLSIYSKCKAMQGKPVQENLNKYLAATLTIGLTIPFTLLVTKYVEHEAVVFMLIYSCMGLVGSAAALHWAANCKNVTNSERTWTGIATALFTLTLIGSFYLLYLWASQA